jgi:hypothetical protein
MSAFSPFSSTRDCPVEASVVVVAYEESIRDGLLTVFVWMGDGWKG